MEQTAIVKRILPDGIAEVTLLRQTECGLSCKSCDGCAQRPGKDLLALADNAIGAEAGHVVTVHPNSAGAAWTAVLVFLLPCIGLIAGYLIARQFALAQGLCILCGFAGAVLGFIPAVLVNSAVSQKDKPEFTIVSLRR